MIWCRLSNLNKTNFFLLVFLLAIKKGANLYLTLCVCCRFDCLLVTENHIPSTVLCVTVQIFASAVYMATTVVHICAGWIATFHAFHDFFYIDCKRSWLIFRTLLLTVSCPVSASNTDKKENWHCSLQMYHKQPCLLDFYDCIWTGTFQLQPV